MGYPLRLLRLSLAVYSLERVIRIEGVVSKHMLATWGITAGSGFATTEMRLVFIRVVDRALNGHPTVNPTLFDDAIVADMIAPGKHILKELGGFISKIAAFIEETGQELSSTKSVCTASIRRLGHKLANKLRTWNIQYTMQVKALGVGLGAGVRRNVGSSMLG